MNSCPFPNSRWILCLTVCWGCSMAWTSRNSSPSYPLSAPVLLYNTKLNVVIIIIISHVFSVLFLLHHITLIIKASFVVIFKVYDTDCNGKVSFDDLLRALSDMTGHFISQQQREVTHSLTYNYNFDSIKYLFSAILVYFISCVLERNLVFYYHHIHTWTFSYCALLFLWKPFWELDVSWDGINV